MARHGMLTGKDVIGAQLYYFCTLSMRTVGALGRLMDAKLVLGI